MEVVCESAQPCIDRMNICCKYMDTHLLAVLPNTDNHKINITVFLLHLPLFMSFIALHVYLIQLYPCSTGECTEYRNSLFKISVVGLPFYFEGFFPLLHLIGCFVDCMKTLTETVDATIKST